MNYLELTINGEVYVFKFGFGFVREINNLFRRPMEGFKGKEEKVGLQYVIAYVVDRDPEYLVTLLDTANKGQTPRITRQALENYIESDCDIDTLFEQVIDFLSQSNCTKNITQKLVTASEEQKQKQEQETEE